MEFGKKTVAKAQYIPRNVLTESVIGSLYEVRIKTKGISNPEAVANLLQTKLPKKFPGLKIKWIGIENNQINIQLTGSPFLWASFLLFLPTILGTIGIVVVLIAVYLLFAAVPGYVIGLLLIGVALIIVGPRIGEWALAGIPTIEAV